MNALEWLASRQRAPARLPKPANQNIRRCAHCGEDFDVGSDGRRIYCSAPCSRRAAKLKQVASGTRASARKAAKLRRRAAVVESVNPLIVFDRDGWVCQICHRGTPKELRGTIDDLAPELDHIIPISRGGEHSYANTQCSCRRCNGLKGDSLPA